MFAGRRRRQSRRMIRILGLLVLAAAVATDLRRRKIPNALTVPALAAIVAASGCARAWSGVAASLGGAVVCAAPLFLAALPGWVGMGDVKLIAVAGAAA